MHSIVADDVGVFVENDWECSATRRHEVDRDGEFEAAKTYQSDGVGSEVGFVVTVRVKSDLALENCRNDCPNTGECLDGELGLEKTVLKVKKRSTQVRSSARPPT
jgi:hypothetical protein